jgi:3-deoxy-7-phosphoheptulonate synthase
MEMQMEFIRKLPSPQELMQDYPLGSEALAVKAARDKEIKDIFSGTDDRFILVIGPCSADNEDAVLDYVHRLAGVQEKVKDKLMLIPRVYTNKPRTIGVGYKGMLHQANPEGKEDMLAGITAIRKMHVRVVQETGLTSAEEILYPENHRYLSDILSYAAIGARSV